MRPCSLSTCPPQPLHPADFDHPLQRHAITKLRDKLKCRTEKQVDDAVQRLETQIHTHNFKLREEEKIVREINELKKSKRTIRDYDSKKVWTDVDRAVDGDLVSGLNKRFRTFLGCLSRMRLTLSYS